ncbi:MAG TPA: hypothetical protein PKH07_15290 [bacterium]|nr:hypothetical protein [bacterium]
MLFRIIAVVAFAGAIVALPILSWLLGSKRDFTLRDILNIIVWIGVLDFGEMLLYIALVLSILVLAATGFWASLVTGHEMTGLVLMTHVSAGGAFAVILALFAVLQAERSRMDRLNGLSGIAMARRVSFWALLGTGLVVTLTTMLSMTPLFGTYWQQVLYEVHRYGAVAAVIAALGHLHFGRFERRLESD